MDLMKRSKGYLEAKQIVCGVFFLFLLITSVAPSDQQFGFDSANSCSPNSKTSRRGRAQMLAAIPCDLAKQPFCHLPGSIYPWHAVRRFVHENQGLMKRMYGDVRHISILRDEIQNNDIIDIDSMDDAALRYSKKHRSAKYMLNGKDTAREEYNNYKSNDVLMEPHFRPMTTVINKPSQSTTSPTPAIKHSVNSPSLIASSKLSEEQPKIETNRVYELSKPEVSNATNGFTNSTQLVVEQNVEQIPYIFTNQTSNGNPLAEINGTTAAPKLTTDATHHKQNTSENSNEKTSLSTDPIPLIKTKPTEPMLITLETNFDNSSTSTMATLATGRNVTKPIMGSTTPASFVSLFSPFQTMLSSDKKVKPALTSSTNAPTTSTKSGFLREGQLFQDAIKQEPVAVSSTMRGVNACPVKDEVVAPFWANNTRGEVLALLNLYPFEQYVHWEKCTHEFKQMFCRDGCRCEQQYRLHRLLAYDPHNECRGIFSDWFRFPSSCICKCYNIPLDFRVTSRSPRFESSFDTQKPLPIFDPIEAAESEVQRAIYEHATDQWYRPRDEYEFVDG